MTPTADFVPSGTGHTHDEVLLEWTAKDPKAAAYDGGAPRELFRVAHPFPNHNGGEIAFNPLARPGTPEFGLLYIGSADGGSGGDPYNHAQNLKSVFGKILRIDPLGKNSTNGKYGIPAVEPVRQEPRCARRDLLVRPPQSAAVLVGSEERQHVRGGDRPEHQRGDQPDHGRRQLRLECLGGQLQVLQPGSQHRGAARRSEDDVPDRRLRPHRSAVPAGWLAATGIYVYREKAIKQLTNMLIFGDNPSGEIFYVNADTLPKGGQNFHRILFNDKGETKTLLQLIKEKNTPAGQDRRRRAPTCAWVLGPNGQLFVLNKRDGTIRLLVP